MIIREEGPEDEEAVRAVNERAFGQPAEANIVDRLRQSCPGRLPLVALERDKIMGYILSPPAKIIDSVKMVEGMGLAPVAVLLERQCQDIGYWPGQAGHRDAEERGLHRYHRARAS